MKPSTQAEKIFEKRILTIQSKMVIAILSHFLSFEHGWTPVLVFNCSIWMRFSEFFAAWLLIKIFSFLLYSRKLNRNGHVFVYSKSEYTKIGQCGRPAGRLHDNSCKSQPIVLELLPIELSHQYLDRVRRWEWFVKDLLNPNKTYQDFL